MRFKTLLAILITAGLMLGATAYGVATTIYQRNIMPVTDSTYELGTSTKSWLAITTDKLCLSGDTCQTAWPAGGSGTFTTTTIEGITNTVFDLVGAGGLTISTSSNQITFTQGAGSGGFTTTSINGAPSTTFNFTTSNDTNITLAITTSTDSIIFTPGWTGTLADSRITSADYWNGLQANASSSYLLITASTSFPNLTQVGTLANLVWTNATGTNLNVTGSLNLPNNSVLDGMISSASYWNGIQANASSSYLTIAVSTSLAYLNFDYPATATNTFVSKTATTSFPNLATVGTITSGVWQGTLIDILRGGTNSTTVGSNGCVKYSNGTSYDCSAVGTLGDILMSVGAGRPVWVASNTIPGTGGSFTTTSINGAVSTTFNFTTSSDTNIGLSITTSTDAVTFNPYWVGTLADNRITNSALWNNWVNYPALATSTFVSKPATPTQTSTYQMNPSGLTMLRPNATTSKAIFINYATPTFYMASELENGITVKQMDCLLLATATSGVRFDVSYGASMVKGAASTTLGTFTVQSTTARTSFVVSAVLPQENYLRVNVQDASTTRPSFLECRLLGSLTNN